jgi:Cache domain
MPRSFCLGGIQGRLFLLIVIVLIPVLLLDAIMYYTGFEGRKTEELQANLELARVFAKKFETFLQNLIRNELAVGLSLTGSRSMTDPDRNRLLDEFQAGNPEIQSVFWLDPSGLVTGSSLRTDIGSNLHDFSFFKKIKGGRDWAVSELIVGKATGRPVFTVCRGIRNEKRELLGVVGASVEPDRMHSILGIDRAKDAGLSLIDDRGMHVYRYPPTAYTWEGRNWLRIYPEMENSLKGKDVLASVTSELTGKKRLVAFTPIPSVGWVAAASRAELLSLCEKEGELKRIKAVALSGVTS